MCGNWQGSHEPKAQTLIYRPVFVWQGHRIRMIEAAATGEIRVRGGRR